MELSHDQQLEIVNNLVNEFWPDTQQVHTDIAHDIMNKVQSFSEEAQLTVLIEVMATLLTLEIARFTCVMDRSSQNMLWNDLKKIALDKGELMFKDFKKSFRELIDKAQENNEDSN